MAASPTQPPGVDPRSQAYSQPGDTPPNPAAQAGKRLATDFAELREFAAHFAAALVDRFKAKIRSLIIIVALGVIGLIAGGAIVATAAGMIIVGFGHALGALFGGHIWLGEIVAGLLVLGAIAASVMIVARKLIGGWRAQTVKRYEQRKQKQREHFGRDVETRAAQSAQ